MTTKARMTWKNVGSVDLAELEDTRLQMHWAAQVVAAIGYTFASPEPDWSHTSLQLSRKHRMLVGQVVGRRTRAGLSLDTFELAVLRGEERTSMSLNGMTLDEAYDWLQSASAGTDPDRPSAPLVRPNHEMPEHPVGSGAAFDTIADARQELANWFRNAHGALERIARQNQNASPVRCWPHHFDIATLIALDPGKPSEDARTIGSGLSPGDTALPEPYFYVTPWPYPDPASLPTLPVGYWNTDGWVGAVLKGRVLVALDAADKQRDTLHRFFDAAIAAARRLVDRD